LDRLIIWRFSVLLKHYHIQETVMRVIEITRNISFLAGLLLLSFAALYATNSFTEKKIQEQIQSEREASQSTAALKAKFSAVFPDGDSYEKIGTWVCHGKNTDYYSVIKNSQNSGYIIECFGQGYSSLIHVILGLDTKYTIKGIDILDQDETPGLGSRVTEDEFKKQFCGKRFDNLSVVTDGSENGIQGITAATISSRAVCEDAVKSAVMFLKNLNMN
jgi:electron transport complex protein RnfG